PRPPCAITTVSPGKSRSTGMSRAGSPVTGPWPCWLWRHPRWPALLRLWGAGPAGWACRSPGTLWRPGSGPVFLAGSGLGRLQVVQVARAGRGARSGGHRVACQVFLLDPDRRQRDHELEHGDPGGNQEPAGEPGGQRVAVDGPGDVAAGRLDRLPGLGRSPGQGGDLAVDGV